MSRLVRAPLLTDVPMTDYIVITNDVQGIPSRVVAYDKDGIALAHLPVTSVETIMSATGSGGTKLAFHQIRIRFETFLGE